MGSVLDIVARALLVITIVSAPPLLAGLIVGLIVSIFQAVTSIQEQTLAFIPKILVVLGAIVVFGNFMFTTVEEFTIELIRYIPEFIRTRNF